jgi:hypothetical protein
MSATTDRCETCDGELRADDAYCAQCGTQVAAISTSPNSPVLTPAARDPELSTSKLPHVPIPSRVADPQGVSGRGSSFASQLRSPLAIVLGVIFVGLVVTLIVVTRGAGPIESLDGYDSGGDHEDYLSSLLYDPAVMSKLKESGTCLDRRLVNNNPFPLRVTFDYKLVEADGLIAWELTKVVRVAANSRANISLSSVGIDTFGLWDYTCRIDIVDVEYD